MSHFKALFSDMLPAIEAEMRAVMNVTDETPDLFDGMIHYHMGWADENLSAVTLNAGKRIRPIVCLLTCAAAGGDWQQAIPAAAAIEILHNFTLVHDDIQDASPLRRGRKTLWTIWGSPQAINTGDAMFTQAHLAMLRLAERGVSAELTLQAVKRLDETCLELTRGQFSDMSFETRDDVTTDEYMKMIERKTAVLIALSAELGARIAGADEATVQHYAEFSRNLGLSFQVEDDILGIWGDEALTGKSAATDIETRKKSLPVLFGLSQSQQLRDLYQNDNDPNFVQTAIALLDELGTQEFTQAKATHYSEIAISELNSADPSGAAGKALHELIGILLQRKV